MQIIEATVKKNKNKTFRLAATVLTYISTTIPTTILLLVICRLTQMEACSINNFPFAD